MLFIHSKLRALASLPEGMNVRPIFWPMESATQAALDVSRAVLLRKTVDSVSIALKDSVCVSDNASMNPGVAA